MHKRCLWLIASIAFLLPTILLAEHAKGVTTTRVIYSPDSISNIEGRVFVDQDVPLYLTNMSIFGQTASAASQTITGWNLGSYTGVTTPSPLGNYQRGIDNSTPGSSAVQMVGTQAGVLINTTSIPVNATLANAQIKYKWAYADDIRPWEYDDSAFNISFQMKIPQASMSGGACAYVGATIILTNSQNQEFSLGQLIFDTRGTAFVQHDLYGLESPGRGYAGGFFGAGSDYCSPLPGSNTSTGVSWNDWHYFGASVSREQLLNAINDINTAFSTTLSTDVADYRLTVATIQGEVHWPVGNGTMALGIDQWNIWQSGVPTPEPGTLILLLCGLPGLALFLWRRLRRC